MQLIDEVSLDAQESPIQQSMIPRWKERLGGLLIAIIGGGATAWLWYNAMEEGRASLKAALLFPCFFVFGISLILFPGYKNERLARGEAIEGLSGIELITPRWRLILLIALASGPFNVYWLHAYLTQPRPPVIIEITTRYPGADRATILDDVALPVKKEISQITARKIQQVSESVDGDFLTMRVVCEHGNDDVALTLVQNRVALAVSSLPEPVRRHGVKVDLRPPEPKRERK